MNYQEIQQACDEAEETIKKADMACRQAAQLLQGRLQSSGVWTATLRQLKRELQNFNAITGDWKS